MSRPACAPDEPGLVLGLRLRIQAIEPAIMWSPPSTAALAAATKAFTGQKPWSSTTASLTSSSPE